MATVAVWLGWIVAGRALRPVHRITASARYLYAHTLHERIGLRGPNDELKEMADTFDALLDRLDKAFESQQRFVANASHELRSPLAVQRTLVDVALADRHASVQQFREAMVKLRDVTKDTERLVASLLVLAISEQGLQLIEPADLAVLAADALDRLEVEAKAQGVHVEASLDAAVVLGDRSLLESLVGNILENAVRYNHPGGWIKVSTSVEHRRGVLRASNSGEVVPAESVPTLLEPFRRLGRDRTRSSRGAGLGLSIVQAVAAAHGGEVRITAQPNGGLDVVVFLPAFTMENTEAPSP